MFKKVLMFIFVILIALFSVYIGVRYSENIKSITRTRKKNNTATINNVQNNISNEIVQAEPIEKFWTILPKAEKLMKNMTIEEKVGQMFLARYPETEVIEEIKKHNPGGYILFGRDFDNKTPESMLKELEANQSASKINLILGVDEEGGTVVRVSNHKAFRNTKFLSPQQLFNIGGLQKILDDSKEKSELLKSIGLNMNLAPVVDVPKMRIHLYMQGHMEEEQEIQGIYTAELIKTMNESNMISVMKHFPGYGDNVDTHTGIAIDERDYETLKNIDFIPFKKGIESGAPCILVSHNIVKSIDKNKPASLSKNTIEILREDLNFLGIVMTDDLVMDAVKTYVENGEAAVQAVLAGNDMIISSDFVKQKEEILSAINKGIISEDIIDTAVRRILAFKYTYKII